MLADEGNKGLWTPCCSSGVKCLTEVTALGEEAFWCPSCGDGNTVLPDKPHYRGLQDRISDAERAKAGLHLWALVGQYDEEIPCLACADRRRTLGYPDRHHQPAKLSSVGDLWAIYKCSKCSWNNAQPSGRMTTERTNTKEERP